MPMLIPLRIVTMIVGLVLGYAAGTYVEILYEKQQIPHESIISLLSGIKQGVELITTNKGPISNEPISDNDEVEGSYFCTDCCDSGTDGDTEESEGE